MTPDPKRPGADIPLPDPDRLQRQFQGAVERVRARPGLYGMLGFVVLLAVLGVLLWMNWPQSREASEFAVVWRRYEAVRQQLDRDLSARDPLRKLEETIDAYRGTPLEAWALWLSAVGSYGEAFTSDKSTFEQRRPYLEKAVGYLDRLAEEQHDERLLAKTGWFGFGGKSPIEELQARIRKDLEWAAGSSYQPPKPDDAVVAVLRTDLGDVHLRFFPEQAPRHVENFLTLACKGTYNGTAFFFVNGGREEPLGVMAGDPFTFFYPDPLKKKHILRWGKGGVGRDIPPEDSRFRIDHTPGIVTSQRVAGGDWDNAVQFQIVTARNRELDRKHTPFAVVVEGMDVVTKIATQRKLAAEHGPYKDSLDFRSLLTRNLIVEPVRIHKVVVFRNGVADPLEHAFPLAEGETKAATLANAPAEPLPEANDVIYCGRRLVDVSKAEDPEYGVHVPFPIDMDLSAEAGTDPPDPKGQRGSGT